MLSILGNTGFVLLLLLLPFSGCASFFGWRMRRPWLYRSALIACYAAAIVLTILVSWIGLMHHGVSTLVLWVWYLSLLSVVEVTLLRSVLPTHVPYVHLLLAACQTVLVGLLCCDHPFAAAFGPFPPINPILPFGYAAGTVVFAASLGAVMAGELHETWLRRTRYWLLACWAGLTVGCIWQRDLSAAAPWCAATAMLQAMSVQERRGLLKTGTVLLAMLIFLTSTTVLAHPPYRGMVLLFNVAVFIGTMLYIDARQAVFYSRNAMRSIVSKEGMQILSIGGFVLGAGLLVGMPQWPVLKYAVVPLILFLLALSGVRAVIAWQQIAVPRLVRSLCVPVACGCLAAVGAVILPGRSGVGAVTIGVATFVTVVLIGEFVRDVAFVRSRKPKLLWFEAPWMLFRSARRRYGTHIAHAGVVMLVTMWLADASLALPPTLWVFTSGGLVLGGIVIGLLPRRDASDAIDAAAVRTARSRGILPTLDWCRPLLDEVRWIDEQIWELAMDRAGEKLSRHMYTKTRRDLLAARTKLVGRMTALQRKALRTGDLPPPIGREQSCADCHAPCMEGSRYCAQCGLPIVRQRTPAIDPRALRELRQKIIHLG